MKKVIWVIVVIIIIVAGYIVFRNQYSGPTSNRLEQKSTSSTKSSTDVIIKDFAFEPASLIIKVGETVSWTNEDSSPHTIKGDNFNSSNLSADDTYKHTFDQTGAFDYVCGLHPSMKGKVVVNN